MRLPFKRMILTGSAGLGLLVPGACVSIDASLESASESASGLVESLSGSFDSSSESSSGESDSTAQANYLRDVRAYTLAYLRKPGEDGFARGLTRVAQAHGINDWEGDRATFATIDSVTENSRVAPAARAQLRRELSRFSDGG